MAQRVVAPGPGLGLRLGLGWAGPKRSSTWKASALPNRTGPTVAGNDHGRAARSATPSRNGRFGTAALEIGSSGWVAVGDAADCDSGGSASDGSAEGAASVTAGRCAAQSVTSTTNASRRSIASRAARLPLRYL